ncbi:uncharacterized protein LOC111695301 [Eurytemora carolleeae]|uniref:uncharacterized protein LOC111695301 n=1 Tax=Eurytemora carolleeae TaxID=1294199 RepID=UPI000C7612B0|nr:uncharacterized protein LOC111695301 [Eurytemora carolleeae]XP_023320334.1 uncharacterized protein LOC111695301 [Eurytemora carolleeae]XP_023320335.1 uncharacterized protein LOC111695301 [Eurytemora carolleeae]|eukprot:XP_023320333.1 uncharacterized protein LOC111695301 [Eurytemora affinis]
MSTSRLDEGLNLLSDSLDTLASNIQQLTLQVYIQEEKKNKAALDKLTCIRTPVIRHMTQTMEMEKSPWKDGIPKYKRSMVKLPLLRPDSIIDIGSEGGSDERKSSRSSKALSTDGFGTNRKTTSTFGRSKQKLSTLKKFQMTTLQKQSIEKKKDDIAEDVAPDTSEAVAVNTETIHVDTLDDILDQLKLETDNVPDKSTDTFNDYFPEFDESETPNRVSLSDITNTEEEVQIKPRKEIKNSSRVMSIVLEDDFDEPLPTPPNTPSASVSEEFRISSLPTLPEDEFNK